MNSNHFIFNESLCVGCEACVVACNVENNINLASGWRKVYSTNNSSLPGLPVFNLSLACNHCKEPPCMLYCPANAYFIDSITGAVLLSSEKCIGCEYCTWNCPYDSPRYNPNQGVIEKCTFCNSRIENNQIPACADLCPTGALGFSFISHNVKVTQNSIPNYPQPSLVINEVSSALNLVYDSSLFKGIDSIKSISKRANGFAGLKELPLLIFSFVTIVLVSVSASFNMDDYNVSTKLVISITLVFSALISLLHLGKKLRSYRAGLNLKRSWLSREIIFYTIFTLVFILRMYYFPIPTAIIVLFGMLTLLSIDMVYSPLQRTWRFQLHSGQALVILLALFLLFNNFYLLLGLYIVFRLVYTLVFFRHNSVLLFLRFIFPLKAFILLSSPVTAQLFIPLVIVGELIDRILFYSSLKKPVLAKYMEN